MKRERKTRRRKIAVTCGSGNVFAGLGYPDAAERQAKVRLVLELNKLLKGRKLRQVDAAKLLGVPQPKICDSAASDTLKSFAFKSLLSLGSILVTVGFRRAGPQR
jgi:predicted XRE-type DNA-binding protein